MNRVFMVFAFENVDSLNEFRETKNMSLVVDKKFGMMLSYDTYLIKDVVGLFHIPYQYFLLYELNEEFDCINVMEQRNIGCAS